MTNDPTRRRLLQLGIVGGVVGSAGCSADSDASGADGDRPADWLPPIEDIVCGRGGPVDVRGAIYIPSRAFNLYQMWHSYEPAVVERDLTYATRVNLNAVRTWLCYEAWIEDAAAHERALDHFLAAAEDRDISVLLGLFDAIGGNPTPERLADTDPRTATGVSSPSKKVLTSPKKWDEPREYVRWFMERYRDDDRLLAIEIMNEPGWDDRKLRFAEAMFATLREHRGDVPLTVGSTSIANTAEYGRWGSDVHQFHYNFVSDRETFRTMLQRVNVAREALDGPVWLTEWQRARHGEGFSSKPKPGERTPDYSSLAPLIQEAGVGNFFWSLMVKPAWVQPQRDNHVVSGLFHEDGTVWSLDDAQALKAMSGETEFDGEERQKVPEWARWDDE